MNRSAILLVSAFLFSIGLQAANAPQVTANPDFAKVAKNSSANPINVLANDLGAGLKITAVTQGLHGTVSMATTANPANGLAVGLVFYTPAKDYVGQDHFTYTITDQNGTSATGEVSIQVDVPNSSPPPIANPDFAKVPKNSTNNLINVLANDVGTGLVITSVIQGDHGTVAIVNSTANAAGGAIVAAGVFYTPNKDYVGGDHFTYKITAANGGTAVGTVQVAVEAPAPPLLANPDFAKVAKNSSNNAINVLQNDVGTGLRITAVTQGGHGTVKFADNGPTANAFAGVLYTPDTDHAGPDHFTYTITDASAATATGTVTVNVEAPAPPPAPIANPDFARVQKNSSGNPINVLSNDIGTGLSLTSVTQADHGSVTIAIPVNTPAGANIIGNSFCTYTPNKDYVGGDHFTYKITDANGGTATGTVTIQVDGNTTAGPIANPDFAKVAKNSANNPINVLANDIGAGLHITAVTQGAHGTVEIPPIIAVVGAVQIVTYTPAADYVGQDQFTYTIADANGTTAVGNVAIVVDAPTPPPKPVANPDTAEVAKNSSANPINVLHNDVGTGLKITAVTQGDHGSVSIANATANGALIGLLYTPDQDYVGDDRFTYTITDSTGATAVGDVRVIVVDRTPPAPIANPDFAKVAKNSADNAINVVQNDIGIGLSITAVTQADHGTVSIAPTLNPGGSRVVLYTPAADYVGEDRFTYTITDTNGATATGKVGILVQDMTPPPPPKPIANSDAAEVTKNSPAKFINVLQNDIGAGLTITAVTQGGHGTVSISNATANGGALIGVLYKPDTDYVGPDQFTYTITDSNGATAVGNVGILVRDNTPPPPPKPIANPDSAKVLKNSSANMINVLPNDVGTGLKITAVSQGDHGTVSLGNATANAGVIVIGVLYTPDTDYVGPDHFTYTITDANGATATGAVSVQVVDVAPPPRPLAANPDFAKVARNSTDNPINVLQNDVGTGLTVTAVTQGDHGAVSIAPANAVNSVVLYTPATDYSGPDHFTYTITDSNGATAKGDVNVYVSADSPGPRANPDFATTQKNSAGVDINVLANDVGTGLTVSAFTQPAHGTVTAAVNAIGLTYVPAKDFSGLDHFTYTALDSNGRKADGDVSVLVVNTKPSRVFAQASPSKVAPGESVAFFAQVTSDQPVANVQFTWDFGDGSSAKGQTATHAYAAAGTYTATVSAAVGNTQLGSASVNVLVQGGNGEPIARFTVSDVAAIAGSPITFDASSSFDPGNAIVKYDWDFGDGSPAGDTVVVTNTYDTAGAYKVTLTVTNAQGLSGTTSRMLQVLPKNAPFKSRVHFVAKLNFATPGNDTLNLSAMLNVGNTRVGAGTTVGCTIAGVSFDGTLDAKLQDTSSPTERWIVKTGARGMNTGDVSLQLQVRKAALAKAFAAAGAVPGKDPTVPVTIDIPITLKVGDRSVDMMIETTVAFSRNATKAAAIGDGP